MSVTLLQTLHRILRQKSDLNGQLIRGPKQIHAARSKFETAEKYLSDKREEYKQLRMAADRKQLQLREREQKIVVLQGKLNAAKENREYQTLKEQIAADKQANNVLSDEILEILEQIDVVKEEIVTAEARVAQNKQELSEIESQVSQRMAVLRSELDRVNDELAREEAPLDGDLKREYQRLVSAKGEESLAPVDNGSCGGCYQMLTPQLIDKLNMGKPMACPSCGCLLYLSTDRTLRS